MKPSPGFNIIPSSSRLAKRQPKKICYISMVLSLVCVRVNIYMYVLLCIAKHSCWKKPSKSSGGPVPEDCWACPLIWTCLCMHKFKASHQTLHAEYNPRQYGMAPPPGIEPGSPAWQKNSDHYTTADLAQFLVQHACRLDMFRHCARVAAEI